MKRIFKYSVPVALLTCVGVTTIVSTSCSTSSVHYVLHRGLSSRYFENTKDAFNGAGQSKNVWGIETDIYLTKTLAADNSHPLVCAHDINPYRNDNLTRDAKGTPTDATTGTCNPTPTAYDPLWYPNSGTKITDLTLADAVSKPLWTGYCGTNLDPAAGTVGNQIVLNNAYNRYGISGEYFLPTFVDYLNICKSHSKEAVIEIKDENSFWGVDYASTLITELINEINSVNYVNNCTIIAFDGSVFDTTAPEQPFWNALSNARTSSDKKIADTANILFPKFQKLCWADYGHQEPLAEAYRALNNHQNIDVDQSVLLGKGGSDLIKSAHDKQLKVNCWTVNDIADRNALIKLGVDQISGNVLW